MFYVKEKETDLYYAYSQYDDESGDEAPVFVEGRMFARIYHTKKFADSVAQGLSIMENNIYTVEEL